MLNKLDAQLRQRIEVVYAIAERAGEQGVVSWAERAAHDANVLGRLRDRDLSTLVRLEDTFSDEFYREYNPCSVRERELEFA